MDKLTAGLLGAVAGLATMGAAQAAAPVPAAATDALQAASYSDLLSPVPNALELLKASDMAMDGQGRVQLAQDLSRNYRNVADHHHHHHHHQNYSRNEHHQERRYSDQRNDHHHHHHNSQFGLVIR